MIDQLRPITFWKKIDFVSFIWPSFSFLIFPKHRLKKIHAKRYSLKVVLFPFVQEITRRLQKVDQVKDLAAKIRLSQSASDNPTSQLDKVLLEFVRKAVVLAWFFQLLPNSFNLDAETDRKFDESRHTRHSLSEIGSETIADVFWPSLVMKKPSGEEICMFKGVVVTGAAWRRYWPKLAFNTQWKPLPLSLPRTTLDLQQFCVKKK